MKVIPWEDNQNLTDLQRDILIGSLLGDGRLECRSQNGTARYRVHHADSQRELLFWKYNAFKSYVRGVPWVTEWLDKRYGKILTSWFFHTITTSVFRLFHRRFYVGAKKIVPQDIMDDLSPQSIAVWVMDDGCRTRDSIILNTQSFTYAEHILLLQALFERYGLYGTINRDRNNFRLRFGGDSARALSLLIAPHLPYFALTKIVPVTTEFN